MARQFYNNSYTIYRLLKQCITCLNYTNVNGVQGFDITMLLVLTISIIQSYYHNAHVNIISLDCITMIHTILLVTPMYSIIWLNYTDVIGV